MKKWYKIVNQASHTDVYIYDEIGFWGTTAKAFAKEIKAISGDIILHLNSPGGQVFDGLAIYNVLRGHSGSVKTIIEGIAASMASIIALAGDSVEMSENSMYMIHNPLISITGDSEELKKTAGLLDQIKEQLVNIYASHSNLSAEEISDLMDKETWLSAQDALDKGFISSIIPNVPVKNYFVNQFEDNDEYMRFVERHKKPASSQRSYDSDI